MIPRDYVTVWRTTAPWVEDAQVEQDLVISRALVEMFSHPVLARSLAFRGGTALYKLYLTPAARYSEDIDLVQVEAGPAGRVMDAIKAGRAVTEALLSRLPVGRGKAGSWRWAHQPRNGPPKARVLAAAERPKGNVVLVS